MLQVDPRVVNEAVEVLRRSVSPALLSSSSRVSQPHCSCCPVSFVAGLILHVHGTASGHRRVSTPLGLPPPHLCTASSSPVPALQIQPLQLPHPLVSAFSMQPNNCAAQMPACTLVGKFPPRKVLVDCGAHLMSLPSPRLQPCTVRCVLLETACLIHLASLIYSPAGRGSISPELVIRHSWG